VAGYQKVPDGVHVHVRNGSFSSLSSNPMQVCVCTNGTPDCITVFINITKYPGEDFNIPAVVVGESFGTVTASVYSNFLSLGKNRTAPDLEGFQHLQKFSQSAGCAKLQYTVLSENKIEKLWYSLLRILPHLYYVSQSEVDELVKYYEEWGTPPIELLTYPVYINITLLPCPLGFMLHNSQHRCVCHTQLEEHDNACNISDQTVQRSGNMWLNASFVGNTTNGVIIHSYCPVDYCKHGEMNIKLENPDSQY